MDFQSIALPTELPRHTARESIVAAVSWGGNRTYDEPEALRVNHHALLLP